MIDRVQTDLQQKLHKKIFREKEKYFILLEKFEKLQVSQSTDKSSQLLLDTSQQEDHDKSEEPQTPTRLLDKDTMTKPSKVVLQMEDVSVIREKFEAIWKYWMEQVHATELVTYTSVYTSVYYMYYMVRHFHQKKINDVMDGCNKYNRDAPM